MNEPLKGKMIFDALEDNKIIGDIFIASNVKSAVKWLKEEDEKLHHKAIRENWEADKYLEEKKRLLDQAFQDVTEPKRMFVEDNIAGQKIMEEKDE